MAQFSQSLEDLESEYTSLICAHSMIRQSSNKEKELIDILHKIAVNLLKRDEHEAALKELLKIEVLEKHIYGESSLTVAKTIKSISDVLAKLNRKPESKKFEQ
jgi:formyltetrahydrofolate synthetase